MKTKKLFAAWVTALIFLMPSAVSAQSVPAALETVAGEDGSVWERVSTEGFGTTENLSITALCAFQGSLYALTRNDAAGFQIWRTSGTSWEKISVPGFTDGAYHQFMTCGYGSMIEFDDHLYVGIGSKFEGAFLYNSAGVQIWRFDGSTWEPVIANSRDEDESGSISAVSGCSDEDGDLTAEISDASKSWEAGQWAGGVLRITSGPGTGRVFEIVDNTATGLTVQQNEAANMDEYTVCDDITPDENQPELTTGAVAAGDSYEIGMGDDENGFGEIWNKNFIDFEVFEGELYASIAHNYEDGTRIRKTADGLTWEAVSNYSFGLFHGFDLDGNPTGVCRIDGLEDRNGAPVCSSSTNFAKSDVSGTETLYVGGTGSSGCNGRGARVLRLDDGEWNFIVDYLVDDNEEGTNEGGFGDASSFTNSNFQAWSWATYDDRLLVGVARPVGGRIMYTETGAAEDGAWTYIMGGDSSIPDGFDGVANAFGYGANIVSLIYTYESALYAGTFANSSSPAFFSPELFDGADIWRAVGPADALVWSRVTADAFGDRTVMTFQSFCEFNGDLYVGASNLFGNYEGDQPEGSKGCKVYRLKQVPGFVSFSSFDVQPGKLTATLTWQTSSETDVAAFNVYRSASEEKNSPYTKVNSDAISPGGSQYTYTDRGLWFNRTYYYKVEALDSSGASSFIGPLAVTTQKLFGR